MVTVYFYFWLKKNNCKILKILVGKIYKKCGQFIKSKHYLNKKGISSKFRVFSGLANIKTEQIYSVKYNTECLFSSFQS